MYIKDEHKMWIAGDHIYLDPKMANRHGLITGATGTGKTVTLKVLAEGFSSMGVPVFLSDIKGDLSGFLEPVEMNENVQGRINQLGLEGFTPSTFPTTFFDVFGRNGVPVRATVSDVGPQLLSRLMDLNDTQTGIMNLVFKVADDLGWLLIDLKDLRAMLQYVSENREKYSEEYGNIAPQSVSAILRNLLVLEQEGAHEFFGEPAMDIHDWFNQDSTGRGMINVLSSTELFNKPLLYATVMLWLMTELYENLDEQGDSDKPRMVFFFDEAHLLFKDISKALQEKIEQVVKLIRSKGVGIYFITQIPRDIPDTILAQLGNKVQHALRAYTPAEEKAVKTTANSFRPNPEFNTQEVLTALGTGEALISVLDDDGIPGIVKKCRILPPQSQMGAISDDERQKELNMCNLALKYQDMVDRDSAYEFFLRYNAQAAEEAAAAKEQAALAKQAEKERIAAEKLAAKEKAAAEKKAQKEAEKKQKALKSSVKKVASTTGGTIGREIGKTLGNSIGGKFGKTLGGNIGASLGRNILGTFFKN